MAEPATAPSFNDGDIPVEVLPAFAELWQPHRFKVFYGGRGGAKSWAVSDYLLIASLMEQHRVLCAREHQNSIQESVHHLLCERIDALRLSRFFHVTNTSITSESGSEFIFRGLAQNIANIKSMEGITKVWCEEANRISQHSLDVLIPTIRSPNSELIFTFNPEDDDDPVYAKFVPKEGQTPPPDSYVGFVNYWDNPYFPDVLRQEMQDCRANDYEKYEHVWCGKCRTISDAQVFKGKIVVESFTSPRDVVFRYGADWGFGTDPNVLNRCFIKDRKLFIDHEAYGYGIDLNDLAAFWRKVPGAQRARIYCGPSRPETVKFMAQAAETNDYSPFDAVAADSWSGSVEDGIAFLRSFDKIVIHPRCKHSIYDFRHMAWKIDKQTGDVLPVLVGKNDHSPEAIRYALCKLVTRRASIVDAV
jgi:phage terminase large subunit